MKPENPVLLAIIGAAQGIKGHVRVKSFSQEAEGFATYGTLYDARGRAFDVLETRVAKEVVVTRFRGIQDRTAAEALTGTELFVDRSLISRQVIDEDEFLHADLIGMRVVDGEGVLYGTVQAVLNFGAGDILDVSKGPSHSVSIPFTKAAVPDVNLKTMVITVDALAAGLLADEDDEEARLSAVLDDPETGGKA